MNVAMIRMVGRKGNSSRTCGACYSTRGRVKCSRDVAARGRARVSGDFGVKNIVAVLWNVARSASTSKSSSRHSPRCAARRSAFENDMVMALCRPAIRKAGH
jgi:hypothetical protein